MVHSARSVASSRNRDRPPISIAILPLTTAVDVEDFTERLKLSLDTFGDVCVVASNSLPVSRSSAASEERLVEWLNERESHFRHVLYSAGGKDSRWLRRSLRQANRIFLVASATEPPNKTVARFRQQTPGFGASGQFKAATGRFHLVLLHPSGASAATNTESWLAAFPMVTEHHHIRPDRDADFQRLARSINHCLVGLTLGGGFAYGIANVGVIRALRELSISIDCVGVPVWAPSSALRAHSKSTARECWTS